MVYNSHKSHSWYLKSHARVGAYNLEKWELKCLNIKEENPHHQTVKRDASFFGIQSNTETIYTALIAHNPLPTQFILCVC